MNEERLESCRLSIQFIKFPQSQSSTYAAMAHFLFWVSAGSIIGMSFHIFYKTIKEGIEKRRNFRRWAIDEIFIQRRNAFRLGYKEKLYYKSRAIEAKACQPPPTPLNPGRPYGLPQEWSESGREHVWRYILKCVDEPKDVLNLSEVSPLFRWLLREKYKAAKLAEVYSVSLSNSSRENNEATQRRLTSDLLSLRLVCETTRKSVDGMLMKPRPHNYSCGYNFHHLGPQSFFLSLPPGVHNLGDVDLESIPLSADFVLGIQRQTRLPDIIKSLEDQAHSRTLHLNDIFFNEVHIDNLPEVRKSFEKLFELAGGISVRSFFYNTEQSGQDTYEILRKWIPLLPNLQELRVSRRRQANEITTDVIEPFHPAPTLTRFMEMHTGFPAPYLMEILKAIPTLKHLELCHFPKNRLNVLVTGGILDTLPLEIFSCGQVIPKTFLQCVFKWPLRTLVFIRSPFCQISGKDLMEFVNHFAATLKVLILDTYVDKSMGMLKLPHLTRLKWLQDHGIENLDFLNPLISLEKLDINTWLNIPGMLTKEEITAYLRKHNVPRLFPAMKRIKALLKVEENWKWTKVWVRGEDNP